MSGYISYTWFCSECENFFYVTENEGEDVPVRCPFGDCSRKIIYKGRLIIEGEEIPKEPTHAFDGSVRKYRAGRP